MVGWTRRLRCPKCGGTFDYEFVPGASFSAVRLGTSRYLRCPLCQKFSVFSLAGPEPPASPSSPASGSPPRYSDVPLLARGTILLLVPFVLLSLLAAFLLPRPEPSLAVVLVGVAGFVAGAVLILHRSRLSRSTVR
ncbi:MAG TPA: hypothetical protein VMF04_00820 [Thermoplasmata archaeon]|nr:hypothetical protein [Thermoplasmata archaeon]